MTPAHVPLQLDVSTRPRATYSYWKDNNVGNATCLAALHGVQTPGYCVTALPGPYQNFSQNWNSLLLRAPTNAFHEHKACTTDASR